MLARLALQARLLPKILLWTSEGKINAPYSGQNQRAEADSLLQTFLWGNLISFLRIDSIGSQKLHSNCSIRAYVQAWVWVGPETLQCSLFLPNVLVQGVCLLLRLCLVYFLLTLLNQIHGAFPYTTETNSQGSKGWKTHNLTPLWHKPPIFA